MEEKMKRQLFVGQAAKHRGAECEITNVAPDGDNVKVTYPFSPSKRPLWVKVEDLYFPEPLFNSPITSPDTPLYPVGTVLTNAAKESVKVIGRFKQDVKLQLGTLTPGPSPKGEGDRVGGALVTDFQPSTDEPFTMSEEDVQEWLAKTLPSAAADTTPLSLSLHAWEVGQRARLLEDLPDDRWPFFEGDEGVVVESGGELGFKSDRYGTTAKVRSRKGKTVRVLDYCEAVVVDSLTQPSPPAPLPKVEGSESGGEIDVLRERNAFLEKRIESVLLDNKLLNREHDELMQAREDNGKLQAALMDAERRNKQLEAEKARLEKTNEQQSEMLRSAALTPSPSTIGRGEQMRLKTLMSTGGSNGFGDVNIPHGYEIAAITTEVYGNSLTRLVHLIGCGDSPAPQRTEEKAGVVNAPNDDEYEFALKSGASPEEVIQIGNERVIEMAWNVGQAHRANRQTSPSLKLLIGEDYVQGSEES